MILCEEISCVAAVMSKSVSRERLLKECCSGISIDCEKLEKKFMSLNLGMIDIVLCSVGMTHYFLRRFGPWPTLLYKCMAG